MVLFLYYVFFFQKTEIGSIYDYFIFKKNFSTYISYLQKFGTEVQTLVGDNITY
jgi:hypothetical protein